MSRSTTRTVVLTFTAVALLACGKKQPPQQPAVLQETPSAAAPVRPSGENDAQREREREEARLREENARIRSTLEQMVFFDYDRSELRSDARTALDAKVRILRERPDIRLSIEGHADERGSVEYNLALGLRRAESVRSYIANFGIDVGRMELMTFGEERPLVTGTGEAAYARNRRAEFRVLSGLATDHPDRQP